MRRVASVVPLALLLVTLLSGCGSAKPSSTQPDQVIEQVLSDFWVGEYEAAAQHFEGGPAMLKNQPQVARDYIDRICSIGQATSYKVRDRLGRGESVVLIQLTTYKDAEQKEGLRTMTWHFAREGRRWLVTKVE